MVEHDDGPQDAVFADDLSIEGLMADAIWEQIELSRRRGDAEDGPRIDPGFQRDYDNL